MIFCFFNLWDLEVKEILTNKNDPIALMEGKQDRGQNRENNNYGGDKAMF